MSDEALYGRRLSAGSSLGAKLQDLMQRSLGLITAVLLFMMMILTLLDVFGRYLFNSPIMGAYEITELMLVVLIFAGIPLAGANDEHIAVDLIDGVVPRIIAKVRDIMIALVMAVVLGALSKSIWHKGLEAIKYGDQSAMLQVPMSPVFFVISVTLALASLVSLALAWQYTFRRIG
jgi:TRAP-type C4-dicarboxylate transport system permease small subunit